MALVVTLIVGVNEDLHIISNIMQRDVVVVVESGARIRLDGWTFWWSCGKGASVLEECNINAKFMLFLVKKKDTIPLLCAEIP